MQYNQTLFAMFFIQRVHVVNNAAKNKILPKKNAARLLLLFKDISLWPELSSTLQTDAQSNKWSSLYLKLGVLNVESFWPFLKEFSIT